jgi:hypothetical protein
MPKMSHFLRLVANVTKMYEMWQLLSLHNVAR